MERSEKWYERKPKALLENPKVKLLWDFSIQCDENIIAKRPDLILVDKEKKHCLFIDIAAPRDEKVAEKEDEKEDKHQPLKFEIMRIWEISKVGVIPIVVGALGVVTRGCKSGSQRLVWKFELNCCKRLHSGEQPEF